MSTRCQVEFRDQYSKEGEKDVMLYHHYDGYPENMIPTIKDGLKSFDKSGAHPYWWDSERVAAHFVANVDNGDFPQFQPSSEVHGDIEFYYIVTLINDAGFLAKEQKRRFKIQYEEYDDKKNNYVKKTATGKIDK